jgi:transposase
MPNSSVASRSICRASAAMVSHKNLTVINTILHVAESGCKWRALPKRFGTWHTVYTRMNRWAKAGMDKLFEKM